MALTAQQKKELGIAQNRVNQGSGTDADRQNLEFAKNKFGFTPEIPVAAPAATPAAITPPSITSDTNVVSSTRSFDDERIDNRNAASNLATGIDDIDAIQRESLAQLLGSGTFAETGAGQTQQSDLNALRQGLGIITTDDEKQIEAAGSQAGLAFDPIIGEARESKKQGMAKSRVVAGERGGFLNTQFSGKGALLPTEGGDFVGEGGQLEEIKFTYDRNIQALQAEKQRAILAAKAASRQAILTGKREDFDIAQEAFTAAQDAHNQAIQLANEKIQAISSFKEQERVDIQFRQEQSETIAENLSSQLVDIDENGEVVAVSNDEIIRLATENGIDPNILASAVNGRIDEVNKLAQEDRKTFLEETKLLNEISQRRTQVVEADGIQRLVDLDTGEVITDLGSADDGTPRTQVIEADGRKWLVDLNSGAKLADLGQANSGMPDAPTVKSIGDDRFVQWNPQTETWDAIDTSDIPDQSKINKANEVIGAIQSLRDDEGNLIGGFKGSVGAKGFTHLFGLKGKPFAGTDEATFRAKFDRLKALLTLENMSMMKGVLSDSDLKVLREAATELSTDLKEEDFKNALNNLDEKMRKAIENTPGGQIDSITDEVLNPDGRGNFIRELDQETDFNNVVPDTNSGKVGTINIKSGTLADRNNNPGNLRFIGQRGGAQGQGGFARFDSPEAGFQALVNDLKAKQSGKSVTGLDGNSTLKELVFKFAPPNENDSEGYARFVAQKLGVDINTPIGRINTISLAKVVALKESSTTFA